MNENSALGNKFGEIPDDFGYKMLHPETSSSKDKELTNFDGILTKQYEDKTYFQQTEWTAFLRPMCTVAG